MTDADAPAKLRPLLTIAYSTLGGRARNIRLPDARAGIELLMLVQGADAVLMSDLPRRADLRVIALPGRGVARSRNAALDHALGRFLIFADDDITFYPEALDHLLAEFATDPRLALALGQAEDAHGILRKRYPVHPVRLTRFNSAKAATYEMMIRLDPVRAAGLRFDERFGAGMPDFVGDEYIFITDLLKAGLSCRFFPVTLATHPAESSGLRWSGADAMRARKALFHRVFGTAGPVVALLFVARNWRRVDRLADLRHLLF